MCVCFEAGELRRVFVHANVCSISYPLHHTKVHLVGLARDANDTQLPVKVAQAARPSRADLTESHQVANVAA